VFRVITKYRCGKPRPVIERGPWHTSSEMAHFWADTLRNQGYTTEVEEGLGSKMPGSDSSNADLAEALAGMA
jgi:hypothetical protein